MITTRAADTRGGRGVLLRFEPKPTIIARPVLDKLLAGPIEEAAMPGTVVVAALGETAHSHTLAPERCRHPRFEAKAVQVPRS